MQVLLWNTLRWWLVIYTLIKFVPKGDVRSTLENVLGRSVQHDFKEGNSEAPRVAEECCEYNKI